MLNAIYKPRYVVHMDNKLTVKDKKTDTNK